MSIRAVAITTEGAVHSVQIEDPDAFLSDFNAQVIATEALDERFVDLDGTAVLVYNGQAVERSLQWNEKASILVAPANNRHNFFLRGDVYVLWDRGGLNLDGLPERVGEGDIEDVIERYATR